MRLILHVGTPKTGTTSIQGALAENRELLRERGLWFPNGSAWLPWNKNHHRGFSAALTGVDREAEKAAREFIEYLRHNVRPGETVLLSSESAYHQVQGISSANEYGQLPDYWERRQAYLSTLIASLHPFTIEVVIFLRLPSEFAESLYHTLAIEFGWQQSFDDFLHSVAPLFEYEKQLAALRSNFSRVAVVPYRSATSVTSFFDAIGFAAPPGSQRLNRYRSPDPRLTLWFTEQQAAMADDRQAVRRLRKFIRSKRASELLDGDVTAWPSPERRDAFDEAHRAGLPEDFFPPTRVERVPFELTDDTRARINNAYCAWQGTHRLRYLNWLAALLPFRKDAAA